MEKVILSSAADAVLSTMDGLPGCFIRPHKAPTGKAAYRLLDKNVNPVSTIGRNVVQELYTNNFIEVMHSGEGFIYYVRSKRKYERAAIPGK